VRGRRSNAQAAHTRERILAAALGAFSEVGYGAASLRAIAARAGVSQQLITHHFETKLGLWKAVADGIFAKLASAAGERVRGLEGVSPPERMRLVARTFLRFSADHPELARFMMQEGASRGPRLEWLVERHLRPLFANMQSQIAEAQASRLAPPGDPIHIAYLLIGANTLFSQAAEFELLTGRDARSAEVVEAHADLVLGLLLPGAAANEGVPL
jgi:TetR/AcrR family transcriptional regulator